MQIFWPYVSLSVPNEKEQLIELEFYSTKFTFPNGAEHSNITNSQDN